MEVLHPVPVDFWQEVAEACPWATFFHTPAWASVYARTFPRYAVASRGFVLDNGARAVIPLLAEERRKLLRRTIRLKSMEPGVYGGIIADRDLSPRDVDELIRSILKIKNAGGRIVGNPFKEFTLPSAFKHKTLVTQMVDLTPGAEKLWQGFSRGQKSNINQARRKHVAVRLARDIQDIETYYAIYVQTVQRWGKNAAAEYPRELFLNLFATRDDHIRFYLAEKKNRIIAGIIVLAWNTTLIYWQGCSLNEARNDYPHNLLHYTVMTWGCENGYTWYDMGPSLDLEGVARFKASFGAKNVLFTSYRW